MRFYLAVIAAKIVNLLIKITGVGAGYTWPGHVALMIYPAVLNSPKVVFKKGLILVTGTNGKTTTSKLINHVLTVNGLNVVHNITGANLLNGIASSVLLNYKFFSNKVADVGVFEVDEFTLSHALKHINPDIVVLLNLSRDQLDRYGEVDIILERWLGCFSRTSTSTEVVIDVEQKRFEPLFSKLKQPMHQFDSARKYLKYTNLHGSFNAKNVNAAVNVCRLLGLSEKSIIKGLRRFEAAYGRGEIVTYKNKKIQVFLAKNPASFNQNLSIILDKSINPQAVLFVLNDEVRDGRDVSWIFDVNSESLRKACAEKTIFVAGDRYLDMAVRLKYAGVEVSKENIFESSQKALDKISGESHVNFVVALPNYSAMLRLRKHLTGKEIL